MSEYEENITSDICKLLITESKSMSPAFTLQNLRRVSGIAYWIHPQFDEYV